ncbi:MAG: leucyl aminopeptidase family protein, partial [Bacteroidota bacterium]
MKIKKTSWVESSRPVILPFIKGKIDNKLFQEISGLRVSPEFEGEFKKVHLVYHTNGDQRIYLLGLGEESDLNKAHQAFRSLAHHHHKNWSQGVQIDCRHLPHSTVSEAVLGFNLATYQIGSFKTGKQQVEFYGEDFEVDVIGEFEDNILEEAYHTGEAMKRIIALVDAPANQKTPEFLAHWAEDSAKTYGYQCEIFRKGKLTEDGFGAVLAVGQGSVNKPVLIKMEYKPDGLNSESPSLALVGKGITFDTGGISIKGSQNMHYMKSDMGGAAAVLGAMELATRLKLPIHLVGIVASAENAVDANSIKPGDVITSYSGQTIEIIDTDAEGRLVLADALSYVIKQFKPARII